QHGQPVLDLHGDRVGAAAAADPVVRSADRPGVITPERVLQRGDDLTARVRAVGHVDTISRHLERSFTAFPARHRGCDGVAWNHRGLTHAGARPYSYSVAMCSRIPGGSNVRVVVHAAGVGKETAGSGPATGSEVACGEMNLRDQSRVGAAVRFELSPPPA